MAATLIEVIGFVASTVSIKSSLSATSAFHGGGVPRGTGTGATIHTEPEPTNTLIRPSTLATDLSIVIMAMVMDRPALIMATRMGVTTAAITAPRATKMMKVLCAIFS